MRETEYYKLCGIKHLRFQKLFYRRSGIPGAVRVVALLQSVGF